MVQLSGEVDEALVDSQTADEKAKKAITDVSPEQSKPGLNRVGTRTLALFLFRLPLPSGTLC